MFFIIIGVAFITFTKSVVSSIEESNPDKPKGYKVTCPAEILQIPPLSMQSPINIKNTQRMKTWQPLRILFPGKGKVIKSVVFENNNKFVNVIINDNTTLELEAPGLKNPYLLKEIHFHFGCEKSRGSEHQIFGQKYAMEVQFVFWNNVKYSKFEDAIQGDPENPSDGLAILANLFYDEIFPRAHSPKAFLILRNVAMEALFEIGGNATMTEDIEEFLVDLLPNGLIKGRYSKVIINDEFYSYDGSLTTSDCNESVKWFVMKNPKQASELYMLRKLPSSENHPDGKYKGKMCDNFRDIQPQSRRLVYW